MARLKGGTRALIRLLGVQASWNYERMQGTGVGHAAEPVLRAAFEGDTARYRETLGRASAFFNANPYVAAAAVGAEARAEVDGVPAQQVDRLRTALCGPLGSLGDRRMAPPTRTPCSQPSPSSQGPIASRIAL